MLPRRHQSTSLSCRLIFPLLSIPCMSDLENSCDWEKISRKVMSVKNLSRMLLNSLGLFYIDANDNRNDSLITTFSSVASRESTPVLCWCLSADVVLANITAQRMGRLWRGTTGAQPARVLTCVQTNFTHKSPNWLRRGCGGALRELTKRRRGKMWSRIDSRIC